MNSRRKFLVGCSAFAAVTMVAPAGVLEESTIVPGESISANDLDYAAFSRQLNTPFRIHAPSGRKINVSLVEVRLAAARPARPGRKPLPDADYERFSIVFSGARGEMLAQDTYAIEHKALGRFEVFMVPILTRNPAKIDYQTIFNRPRGRFSATAQSLA